MLEKKSFTIESVVDPRTGKRLPVSEAVKKGLLNLQTGTFLNPKTGDKMSIPDAIEKGFIKADSSTSIGVSGSEGLVSNVQLDLGTKTYAVKTVVDTKTGQDLSVTEAVKKGLLDQAMCKYLDQHTGETMSMTDAIKKGYVVVEEQAQMAPLLTSVSRESMTVKSVVDPRSGKEILLPEAIRKGLFDPEKGEVVNALTGQAVPLELAVTQGLAKVESSSTQKKPEDFVVVRDLIVKNVKDPRTGRNLSVKEAGIGRYKCYRTSNLFSSKSIMYFIRRKEIYSS